MTIGDVENSNNKIENHRSTVEKIFHILQIILKQIDHIPVILIILLFISTAIPGWLTEFECVIISVILSGMINLILYVKRHLYQQRIIARD